MSLKPLLVKILGDTTGLEEAVGRIGSITGKVTVGVAALSGAVTGYLTAMTVSGLKAVDSNAKLARSISATTDGLRALQIAANYAGVSSGGLQSAMEMMNRELDKASDKASPVAGALKAIGVSADQLRGMDADDRIALIADRLQALGADSGTTALLLQRLGIRSREMVMLLQGGGDAIRAAAAEVQDFGLSLTQVQTDSIETANDAVDRMGLVFEGLGQKLAIAVAPAIQTVADKFAVLAKSAEVQAVIDRLAEAFGNLASTLLTQDFIESAATALTNLAGLAVSAADGLVFLTQNTEMLTVAAGALAIATFALGGPLWIVVGAAAAAAIGIKSWADANAVAVAPVYDLAAAEAALSGELIAFATSSGPAARSESMKRIVSLKEHAQAALAAAMAEAELANTRVAAVAAFPDADRINPAMEGIRDRAAESAARVKDLRINLLDLSITLRDLQNSGGDGAGGASPTIIPIPGASPFEIPSGSGAGSGGGKGGGKDGLTSRLDQLTEGLRTESEVLAEWYNTSLETLIEAKDLEQITEQEYRDLRERLEKEHIDRMNGIKDGEKNARMEGLKGMFGDLSTLMQTENDKLFAIGKAAAIASASISGWEAAVEAWNKGMKIGGPPVAAAFAGASLLKTGVMIANIASQSPRGGGGSQGGIGSAGSSQTPVAQAPAQVNITWEGGMSGESMGSLTDRLNKEYKDGYQLNFVREFM